MGQWFWMTVTFMKVLGWTCLIRTEHSASWHQRERSAQPLTHCHLPHSHLTPSHPPTHTVYAHELQSDRRVSKQYPIPGVYHCRRWRLAKVTQSSFLTPSLPLFPSSLPEFPLLLSLPPRSCFFPSLPPSLKLLDSCFINASHHRTLRVCLRLKCEVHSKT